MRRLGRALPVALVALALVVHSARPAAQDLVWARFEQYLDALRLQAGIPALSALIMQDQRVVWEVGLGMADVEASVRATPDTPYHIAGLTEPFAAVLVLQCAERGTLDLSSPMSAFVRGADTTATVGQVLSHTADGTPGAAFRQNEARFATLATVVDSCTERPYRVALARDVLDRMGMNNSVPGADIDHAPADVLDDFDARDLARYRALLQRLAKPYRVDRNNKATLSRYPDVGLDAVGGIVATVRELGKFDIGHDQGILMAPSTVAFAFSPSISTSGRALPYGAGWFVQTYNNERIVWQYSLWPDATSSLILKVPGRELTLVLLANSDGLSAPFQLERGDVTTSLFARLFLRLFV
jgi:CubicO group peptidase (beta-lactamase class C family)